MQRTVSIIGGGGVRTPLLIHGLLRAQALLNIKGLRLFDVDSGRAELMASLGREIASSQRVAVRIGSFDSVERAVEGCDFVLSSLRIGGMAARARDERIAIDEGLAGQETTGPGGVAMALRTVPVALEHGRIVERLAPDAWFINFTNPAGLITQALLQHTELKVIGICDTPAELFHRIAHVLDEPPSEVHCDYAGLNHLGWVRRVTVRGQDVTGNLLENENALRELYHTDLFDPKLISTLQLIPSEYLFFYYSQRKAYRNQLKAGATRGEELMRLNTELFSQLRSEAPREALATYRRYLEQRNASYLKLEANAGTAFQKIEKEPDPFDSPTGYHKIAVEVMSGLVSDEPRTVVVNVRNKKSIEDLQTEDVVEVPCEISSQGVTPSNAGKLPESVKGLVLAVKAYERTAIRAVTEKSWDLAQLAMLEYPLIGQWEIAKSLREAWVRCDQPNLGYMGK
ncbi:MAG: 6-phospho-beta-glucosidase [Acidobacteria bacterium]|nr:6-phospho-beta-glucosidase [Acidobacteriota bacterium]MBS1865771.1 6-phospho-beta-glucosidase [Acidobacteriota bacterium]